MLAPRQELAEADPAVAAALRGLPLAPEAIEFAVAREGLERVYRAERWLPRFDAATLARHAQRLGDAERQQRIIARFGRFPHRNAVLERTSTAEEISFLKTPGSSF